MPRSSREATLTPNQASDCLRVLIAHPSPDLYGSDRQLLESVAGLREAGAEVTVCLPKNGLLVPLLAEGGAQVRIVPFPVLRRAMLRPDAFLRLVLATAVALVRLIRLVRSTGPDVLYVNTVTVPVWLLAGRLARTRVLCHVHEAEESDTRIIRWGLTAPMLLAHAIVANSAASASALSSVIARLGGRITVVPNGVPTPSAPPGEPPLRRPMDPARLALVARLSPRKGVDVALDALGLLRAEGRAVELEICGTIFPGYEWFEQQLRARAAQPDLAGRVHFRGYVHPTSAVLGAADVVLVPSRFEPFGNTAVEGLLARRPVVASRTQGLIEIVDHGRTGLLVEPGDAADLADALRRLLDDPDQAEKLATAGREDALARFGVARFRARMNEIVTGLAR